MPESQAAQQSTQAQAQSPQAQPGHPLSAPSQAAQAQQARESEKEAVAAKNPWSRDNMQSKRADLMSKLREDRGVSEPKERAEVGAPQAPQASTERPSIDEAKATPSEPNAPTPVPAVSEAQNEWYKREQAVRDAETRAKDAATAVERRIAEADAREAKAKEAEKRMDWARSNPLEFMAEAGMTEEEWKHFMTNGGKMTPEQKRVREMEKQLAETRLEMQKMATENERHRTMSARQMEDAQFSGTMSEYTLLPQMGGIQAVRNKQEFMGRAAGKPVSLKEAADTLEKEMEAGLSGLLKHEKIRHKLGLSDVDKPKRDQSSSTPRTLNNRVSSETKPVEASPRHKGPPDWKALRAEYERRVAAERQ